MSTVAVQTSEGLVNLVAERVDPAKWDGANWVLFFRHATRTHIAFAWDGNDNLVDLLRERRNFERHPKAVAAEIRYFIENGSK